MKVHSTAQLLIGLARVHGIASLAAIGIAANFNLPSYAQTTTFFCGNNKGVPVTYARTPRGNKLMIRWADNKYFPPPWTPQRRCQEVSRRFQRNYDNGTLKFLNSGTVKGQPVICAASSSDDPCTEKTLLFTLKRGTDANRVMQKLMDSQALGAGKIVNQSGGCEEDCSISINMDVYLQNATAEEGVGK